MRRVACIGNDASNLSRSETAFYGIIGVSRLPQPRQRPLGHMHMLAVLMHGVSALFIPPS